MDADVTESAGPPPDPDDPATGGDQTPDHSAAEEGRAPDGPSGGGSAEGPGEKHAPGGGPGGTPGGETRSGSGSGPSHGPLPEDPEAGTTLDIVVKRKRHWLRWTALGASFVVLVAAGAGWWLYKKLDGNIKTDTSAAAELKAYEKERPSSVVHDAQNILLIGSDSRAGDNRK